MQVRSVDITTVDTNSVPHPGSAKPWNVVPGSGVTVSITLVSGANPATQSAPQLMPAVPLVMVALPLPVFTIVSVRPG